MSWNDVLVWAGVIVVLAALVGAGIWWQTWIARKLADRFLNPSQFEKFDPASRKRLEAKIRRIPGRQELLAGSTEDQPDQDRPDTTPQ